MGAVALGAGGSLAGAAKAATRTRRRVVAGTPQDTLVVAVEGDIDTFDPAFTVGSKPSQTTIQNTFDQLTQYKQVTKHLNGITYPGVDTETILGMLAQSYTRKGNDFIFTLRKGLKYHDGTPITAKEIEQGYRRVFDAKGISYFLLTMAAVTDPSHIKALDTYRVRIRMNQPNLLFLKNNTMHNTSSVEYEEVLKHAASGDKWATAYFKKHLATGNGPFMLDQYVPGRPDRAEAVRRLLRRQAAARPRDPEDRPRGDAARAAPEERRGGHDHGPAGQGPRQPQAGPEPPGPDVPNPRNVMLEMNVKPTAASTRRRSARRSATRCRTTRSSRT